jgi:DNA-binding MarR family transcriptional regulator
LQLPHLARYDGRMPPAPAADQAGFLLQRAHRRLRLAHNDALGPLGLNIAHVAVLALLAEHGDVSQRRLIDLMDADKSTMVYLVDDLERQGLAERRADPADRRAHAVHLTAAGRKRLAEAGAVAAGVEDAFLSPLAPAERTRFTDMLRRIADHVRAPGGPPAPPRPRARARTAGPSGTGRGRRGTRGGSRG